MHNLSLFLAGYDDLLLNEVVQLRSKYQTLKKAKAHSNEVLPAEPGSLVEKYLIGKERPLKEQVVASRNTRYTKPALSSENMENTDLQMLCSCKGKCATRRCSCKEKELICRNECGCSEIKCTNRE